MPTALPVASGSFWICSSLSIPLCSTRLQLSSTKSNTSEAISQRIGCRIPPWFGEAGRSADALSTCCRATVHGGVGTVGAAAYFDRANEETENFSSPCSASLAQLGWILEQFAVVTDIRQGSLSLTLCYEQHSIVPLILDYQQTQISWVFKSIFYQTVAALP